MAEGKVQKCHEELGQGGSGRVREGRERVSEDTPSVHRDGRVRMSGLKVNPVMQSCFQARVTVAKPIPQTGRVQRYAEG